MRNVFLKLAKWTQIRDSTLLFIASAGFLVLGLINVEYPNEFTPDAVLQVWALFFVGSHICRVLEAKQCEC